MRNSKRSMALLLSGSFLCTSSFARGVATEQSLARAKIQINASEILASSGDLRADIKNALQNDGIKKELDKLGITASEVEQRLTAMSDAELQQVKQGVEREAGGEVVIIGLTTILLLIIIYLLVR